MTIECPNGIISKTISTSRQLLPTTRILCLESRRPCSLFCTRAYLTSDDVPVGDVTLRRRSSAACIDRRPKRPLKKMEQEKIAVCFSMAGGWHVESLGVASSQLHGESREWSCHEVVI